MKLRLMTLSITILNIMTLSIATLKIMPDTFMFYVGCQNKLHNAECRYVKCQYDECRGAAAAADKA